MRKNDFSSRLRVNNIVTALVSQISVLLFSLLTGSVALAQQLVAPPSPSDAASPLKRTWYVGMQFTAQRYAVLRRYQGATNKVSPNTLSFIPAQLIAGCQLTNRLALQTGLAYRRVEPNLVIQYTNQADGQLWEQRETAQNSWAVPLLIRWKLAASTQRPLRVELLAGLVYLQARNLFYDGPVAAPLIPSTITVQTVQGTLGLGLVRAFGPRLTGNFDLLLNRSFDKQTNANFRQIQATALSYYTANLGMRYNFR